MLRWLVLEMVIAPSVDFAMGIIAALHFILHLARNQLLVAAVIARQAMLTGVNLKVKKEC